MHAEDSSGITVYVCVGVGGLQDQIFKQQRINRTAGQTFCRGNSELILTLWSERGGFWKGGGGGVILQC